MTRPLTFEDCPDDKTCSICYHNNRNIIILDCRHLVLCHECADIYDQPICPICKSFISEMKMIEVESDMWEKVILSYFLWEVFNIIIRYKIIQYLSIYHLYFPEQKRNHNLREFHLFMDQKFSLLDIVLMLLPWKIFKTKIIIWFVEVNDVKGSRACFEWVIVPGLLLRRVFTFLFPLTPSIYLLILWYSLWGKAWLCFLNFFLNSLSIEYKIWSPIQGFFPYLSGLYIFSTYIMMIETMHFLKKCWSSTKKSYRREASW